MGARRGGGPPLLLFHGWNGSSDNLGAWLPALEPHFEVLVPDLPGCAGVPPLPSRHTALAYATWALDLLATLGLERVSVGGLCSGTAIALALADVAPERVAALLLHTPFLRPELIRPLIRAQLALLVSPAGALWGPIRRSTTLSMLHLRLFADGAQVEAEQLAHDQADLLMADARAGRELARDLLAVDRTGVVRGWRGPLGVLLADHDAFVDTPRTVIA
ncbi:MAG TPA: alpha/beta fold hydrolase, partial [Candidatus Limnocylindria bacterium]|nr:alpha/beta fold hydrolase [Candidatus Limnocylindria bacterium]